MSDSGSGGASWRGCGMQCCAPSDPSSTNQEQSSLFPARATHEPLPWPGSRGCTIMRRATCLSRLKSGDVEAAGGVLQPHAPPSAAGVKRARCEYALPQSPQSSDKDTSIMTRNMRREPAINTRTQRQTQTSAEETVSMQPTCFLISFLPATLLSLRALSRRCSRSPCRPMRCSPLRASCPHLGQQP